MIRLVTFDALHTIITPRLPIYAQYSQVFAPYLGVLPQESIKHSFKIALKSVQKEHPSYNKGAEVWWSDVIRRTALGAGGNEQALDLYLSNIVQQLMVRFNSKEGYKAFADAIPTIHKLHSSFRIRTAVVSNGDSRIRNVLKDLRFPSTLQPVVLSEKEGVEKPAREIFMKTLELVNQDEDCIQNPIHPRQCLHIGDELLCDYHGAMKSGWNALLLRRPGPDGEHEHKEVDEALDGVNIIQGLDEATTWIREEGYKVQEVQPRGFQDD
ncbi:hypothetical protein HYPSUDRAFT_155242 [Hypholoma sublateritium FD-334 SS-4]|uniref:Uncharacterized protein n=1 Tax=Hypholoma sublateritium (strain FD-334 SS-4) TaxID=945553 RepID=A0A0D2PDT7_HYPSF|nr:hypothetical protein HYPSUDRAFT_155242 [Hypholoma sublateritium FD-334 SS-4]